MRRLPALLLSAVMLAAFCPPVSAQINLPGVTKAKEAQPPALSVEELRQSVLSQIDEATQQRERWRQEGGPAAENLRLQDVLLLKLHDRRLWLEETLKLQSAPEATVAEHALAGPPPYDVLAVDALRDEFDRRQQRLGAIQSRLKMLELEKANYLAVKRQAEERVRLARETAAATRENAGLRLRIADAELAAAEAERGKLEIEAGRERVAIEKLGVLVRRVVPQQHFSAEALAQVRAESRNAHERLLAEMARVNERGAHLEKEMRKRGAPAGSSEASRMLVAQLETEQQSLQLLAALQTLENLLADAWEARFQVMNSEDAAERVKAIARLRKAYEGLRGSRGMTQERLEAARTEVREQALRLETLAETAAEFRPARALLATLQQRVNRIEKLELGASRLQTLIGRWLGDFEYGGGAPGERLGRQMQEWGYLLWNYELFSVEDTAEIDGRTVTVAYGVTIRKSVGAMVLFLVGYWLCALLARHLQKAMVQRLGVAEQVAQVIRRWLMILFSLLLLLMVLNLVRIPLTVFAFLGGALAIGVGFGTQTIIKNFISGIIILFERKIRVGDIVQLGGMTGTVVAVDLRASTVRGFDGLEALVPNSSFLENQVVNWTYSNSRVRRTIRIGVAYGADMPRAAALLAECAGRHVQVLREPAPEVLFEDFGDSAQMLALYFWVDLGPNVSGVRVESELRFAIEAAFRQAGIAIPFPQRELHLHSSQPLAVSVVAAGAGGKE